MFFTMINPRQACDSCHKKKQRCVRNIDRKCDRCKKAGFVCTFLAVHKKKGRKLKKPTVTPDPYGEQQGPNLASLEKYRAEKLSCEDKYGATAVNWEAISVINSSYATQDMTPPEMNCEAESVIDSSLEAELRDLRRGFTLSPSEIISQPKIIATEVQTSFGYTQAKALEFETATFDHTSREMFERGTDNQAGDSSRCIYATNRADVPHGISSVTIPINLSSFPATVRINISLPVSVCLPSSVSLVSITKYLTAFALSPASSSMLQLECQELLMSLSIVAVPTALIVQDGLLKTFLALLSQVGKHVTTENGIVDGELCGLSESKAIVRSQGNMRMVDINSLARVSAFY
ncbi:hypothetical protein EJ07DRAFT_152622 [Lizonia empirigonia]|nr:hypothetical protein EJ07DRAFT_152622 [Lizonia empirigonia]